MDRKQLTSTCKIYFGYISGFYYDIKMRVKQVTDNKMLR